MNKYIRAILFFTIGVIGSLTAQCAVASNYFNADEYCQIVKMTASVTMIHRQFGAPKEVMLENATSAEGVGESVEPLRTIIDMAYTKPRHKSASAREQEVDDFGRELLEICRSAVQSKD